MKTLREFQGSSSTLIEKNLEVVADQLTNAVADGLTDREEFVSFVSAETNFDKNALGKVYDAYLDLDARERMKLDMTRNMMKFLKGHGLKESELVSEAKALDFIVTSIPSSEIPQTYLPKAEVGMGLSMHDKLGKGYVLTIRDYTLDYRKGKVALVLSRDGKQKVKARMGKDSTYLQKLQKFANDYLRKYVKDIKESVVNKLDEIYNTRLAGSLHTRRLFHELGTKGFNEALNNMERELRYLDVDKKVIAEIRLEILRMGHDYMKKVDDYLLKHPAL